MWTCDPSRRATASGHVAGSALILAPGCLGSAADGRPDGCHHSAFLRPQAIHASVHTGPAVARDGDYFGHTVNLAARLLDSARGDELLATEEVVRATADGFGWRHLGLQAVRGFGDPIDVWSLSDRHGGA